MKFIFILFLFFSFTGYGEIKGVNAHKLLTAKYAGVYSYGKDIEKERVGEVTVYPETDSTVLFYIDLCRGAPSYNIGIKYGRIAILNDTGTYYYDDNSYEGKGCKWYFKFSEKTLTIKTVDGQYECGFGNAVFADGTFKKKSGKAVGSFIDMTGDTIYFKKTPPEDYDK